MKICFTSSSGGHFEQLMMLKPLMKKYDSFIVTEKVSYNFFDEKMNIYYVKQINRRDKGFILSLLKNTFDMLTIFLKEKPDIIISTGALSSIPICIIGKIFQKKLIYIESFAKINSPTLTGKLLYNFADDFYIQWEEMLDIYPEAKYVGSIY